MFLVIRERGDGNFAVAYHERGMESMPAHTTTDGFATLAEAVASVEYAVRWSLPTECADGDIVLVGRTA